MSSRPPQLLVNGIIETNTIPLTPTSPGFEFAGSDLKNRRSLKQLWNEADKRFFDETGYHIGTAAPLHKDGVLQKWQGRYNGEKSEMRDKMDRLSPILQNIVNGIEIVGGFAASAASAVFGPAQMCFSAITFVLDAPSKIKQVYDCLEALFKEVSNFLVKFRVLDRIDEKGQLDMELLENANKLLISFTHICAVAAKLLKKKRHVLQALETVFLMNDGGVQAALIEFKELAVNQAQTVGIISLEHVLNNEQLSQQILSEQFRVSAYLRAVSTKENDEKTRLINKQKIVEIESKLFFKSELDQLVPTQQTISFLPGTLDALLASREYTSWSAMERVGTSEMYLSGSNGTGKTHLIEALREYLDQKRQKMPKGAPSLYVAYHSFADRRTNATSDNAVAQALKSLARQVAIQSTRYAAVLSDQLRDQKLVSENNNKKVWSTLQLFGFSPPPGSVMYLLIDGLQGEDGSKYMQALRALLVDAKTTDDAGGRYKVCMLLAGMPDVIFNVSVQRSMVIDMEKLNKRLLINFIDSELQMQEILIESEEKIKTQRAEYARALLEKSEGNFHAARQKIKRMKEALDDDATSHELEVIIEEDVQQTLDQQARETLNSLADSLRPKHLDQLKKILMWMLYGLPAGYWWEVSDLQAVLRLEQKDQTLESLPKKITKRFYKILTLSYGIVYLDWSIKEYLRELKDVESPEVDEDARLISMTINIKNAKKTEVQKFMLDLSAHLASDTSVFSESQISSEECRVQVSEIKSLVEITLLSLTALNEGTPDDATDALGYAFKWLPRNLTELLKLKDKISSTDWKQIQAGLVTFLSEPYYLEQEPDLKPRSSWEGAWFGESKNANSFSPWLGECLRDSGSHRHLQARQRRWLQTASIRNDGRPDYLRDTALAIAERWRSACLEQMAGCIEPCYGWLGGYLDFLNTVDDKNDENEEETSLTREKLNTDDTKDGPDVSKIDAIENLGGVSGDVTILKEDETAAAISTPTAAVKRLYRVADWVKGNLPAVQEDASHFYCIAATLFEMEEYPEAANFFEKAKSDVQIGWRAIAGMARIKIRQELPDEAPALFREAILLARELQHENKLVKHESDLFVDTLKRLAYVLVEKLKQNEEATQLLRELLEHSPKDGESRWFLFTALCKEEHYEEAGKLLDAWSQHPEEYGDQDPCGALHAMAAEHNKISALFDATREQNLRDRVTKILQQAADDAGSRSQCLAQTRMLYVLATAYANNSVREDRSKAVEYLENILEQSQAQVSDRDQLNDVLVKALLFATRMKFDEIRKQITGHEPVNGCSPETLRDDLQRYITRMVAPLTNYYRDPYSHVASLCIILERPEWSRDLLREQISDAVEILSDDDPENDLWGVRRAVRPFFCHGSDVDARIAFSLLDRTVRTKNLLDRNKDRKGEDDDAIYEGDARGCNICSKDLETIQGYWICRWCPDVDFCQPCLEAFRKGEKHHEHCSPEHEFVHLYHQECGLEELEMGKVLIDWEIQYEENGDFSRKGGRIADISEWLEKLRVEWELSVSSTDTRAQA